MELAMTAKEPYNYFLLLRNLFRSIGGGDHDLLYQQFLPLLPNLLQGKFLYGTNNFFSTVFRYRLMVFILTCEIDDFFKITKYSMLEESINSDF